MKIFLTGATGFIGSYIGSALSEAGHELLCLRRKTSDLRRCSAYAEKVSWTDSDSEWAAWRPQAIVHAAWSGVTAAERDDDKLQAANVDFFSRLLRTSAAAGTKRFVALGSAAEYGRINGRVSEEHPCQPVCAYGKAKLACLNLLEDFAAKDNLVYAWLRLFSTYGPGQGEAWFMPGLLKQLRAGQAPRLTLCEQRYDYLHVEDIAAGVAAVLDGPETSGVFNLGSNTSVPLKEIARRLQQLSGSREEPVFGALAYRPDQSMRLEGDSTKFYATFGFAPRFTLEQGLRDFVGEKSQILF